MTPLSKRSLLKFEDLSKTSWYHLLPEVYYVSDLIQRQLEHFRYKVSLRRARIWITGPSGSGKSTFGRVFSLNSSRSFIDLDELSHEVENTNGVRWEYIPMYDLTSFQVVFGCCDNESVFCDDFRPHIVLFVIPSYTMWIDAMVAKAKHLGDTHPFFSGLAAKAAFTELEFEMYYAEKLSKIRELCSSTGSLKRKTRPLVIPVKNALKGLNPSVNGWCEPGDINHFLLHHSPAGFHVLKGR